MGLLDINADILVYILKICNDPLNRLICKDIRDIIGEHIKYEIKTTKY